MLVVVAHSFLFFVLLLLFFIRFFLFDVVLHSLLFNVIPHPSVDYRLVFTPILYFQPSPSKSDSLHFHFNLSEIFFLSFTILSRGLRFWVGIFYPKMFFTLRSFTDILPAFIKASVGAGSSSFKFSRLHTDPRSTDPAHLFVWLTVIHNHIQKNSFLNSTTY